MSSKAEMEFLNSPEKLNAAYARVLHHRIRAKTASQHQGFDVFGSHYRESYNDVKEFRNGQQNQISVNKAPIVESWWAEPDLNRRPLARKANVLTRLDDRPSHFGILQLNLSCLE